jgi:uncharacterized SAM-binding protein YcdF (DUF218 family)
LKGLVAGLVALMIWTAGLLAFADRIVRLTPAPTPAPADGVVALTGGSELRLRVATSLLEAGEGRRLLVSGVNRRVSRERLWSVTGAAKPLFDCCVDLDFDAADTIGNARETAHWARAMGYRSLILVTADYHTPRAALELKAALPEARISAYPVVTPDLDARHWADTGAGAHLVVVEYMKYLAALGREGIISLGARAPHDASATRTAEARISPAGASGAMAPGYGRA